MKLQNTVPLGTSILVKLYGVTEKLVPWKTISPVRQHGKSDMHS